MQCCSLVILCSVLDIVRETMAPVFRPLLPAVPHLLYPIKRVRHGLACPHHTTPHHTPAIWTRDHKIKLSRKLKRKARRIKTKVRGLVLRVLVVWGQSWRARCAASWPASTSCSASRWSASSPCAGRTSTARCRAAGTAPSSTSAQSSSSPSLSTSPSGWTSEQSGSPSAMTILTASERSSSTVTTGDPKITPRYLSMK